MAEIKIMYKVDKQQILTFEELEPAVYGLINEFRVKIVADYFLLLDIGSARI